MIVADSTINPSLLPYLNGHPEGISFQFVLSEQHIPIQGDTEEGSGPFSLLRNGRIIVDGQQRLMDVMFVIQSDFYSGVRCELRPQTNMDVESIWQQTWAQVKRQDDETGPTVLPRQIDNNGALTPFRSLFYCTFKDSYCHPLCPICGNPLVLCCDDDLLEMADLFAYSKSLYRYLYCAACHQKSNEACFYARDLKGSSSARVKDSQALIQAFSRLLYRSDLSDHLPCIECTESKNCYGPEMFVLNRMQPLQFYPFHMLIHHAPTLNALEFLALVSGARSQKLSRVNGSGFLFEQDDRLFLETLCLKLTFLYELYMLINSDVFIPVSRMSLRGIGVDMKTQGAHLPYFWNFSLRLINPIGTPTSHPPGSGLSRALIHQFLGHAWFYVLLVNGTQQMVQLNTLMDEYLVKDSNLEINTKKLFRHNAFDPGHIFWQPRPIELVSDWHTLWLESLEMGMTLLRAGSVNDSEFSPVAFENGLKELKSRVQQCLFKAPAAIQGPASETLHDTNTRIANILSDLLEQWPQTAGLSKKEATINGQKSPSNQTPEGCSNKSSCFVETGNLIKEDALAPNRAASQPEDDPEIDENVTISPQIDPPDSDLAETVLISSFSGQLAQRESSPVADVADTDQLNKSVENELDETVIVQFKKG